MYRPHRRMRRRDVERTTGWDTIAVIPTIGEPRRWRRHRVEPLPLHEEPPPAAIEAYRRLRTVLVFLARERPLRVVQLTGPGSGEGTSTTAAWLAVSFARSGRRVVLVDADLARPSLRAGFRLEGAAGFSTLLQGTSTVEEALHETWYEGLQVVPAGPTPRGHREVLDLDATAAAVAALAERADVLIVDTPPVLAVTDPLVLSQVVDTTLVVVNPAQANRRRLRRTGELLAQAQAPVLGVVLNRVVDVTATARAGYGRHHLDAPARTAEAIIDLRPHLPAGSRLASRIKS